MAEETLADRQDEMVELLAAHYLAGPCATRRSSPRRGDLRGRCGTL